MNDKTRIIFILFHNYYLRINISGEFKSNGDTRRFCYLCALLNAHICWFLFPFLLLDKGWNKGQHKIVFQTIIVEDVMLQLTS